MSGPVSSHLAAVQRRLTTIGDQIALTAARAVADGVTAQIAADGGRLSRDRGGQAPVVTAKADGHNAAETKPTEGAGQLAIMESGAKAHTIGGRGKLLASQSGGGFSTGTIRHPGARGKRTWTRGVARGLPTAHAGAARIFKTVTDG